MRLSSVLVAIVALVLIVSLLCVWFYPSMQDYMASNSMWNGIRTFTREFDSNNIASLEDLPRLPAKNTLVLIPYTEPTSEDLAKVRQFVADGGTLLLMDDFGYGNDVLAYFGLSARFRNKALLDPLFCYKNQWMPIITDFSPEIKESNINKIIFNHGTSLINVEESQTIAYSSGTSFLDVDRDEHWNQDEPNGPFPVAAKFYASKGIIYVVSDPSIIINSMVDMEDNYRFVEYLTSQDDEKKDIVVALSHLPEAPLDVAKKRLNSGREILSTPYALLGIVALVFVVTFRYMLRKGGYDGR